MLDLSNVELIETKPFTEETAPLSVTAGEVKKSKAGHEYLSLSLKVLNGANKDRIVFVNLNLAHPKEMVRNIANRDLKGLLLSAKINQMTFSTMPEIVDLLKGKTLTGHLIPDGDYGKVKKFIVDESPQVTFDQIPF